MSKVNEYTYTLYIAQSYYNCISHRCSPSKSATLKYLNPYNACPIKPTKNLILPFQFGLCQFDFTYQHISSHYITGSQVTIHPKIPIQ